MPDTLFHSLSTAWQENMPDILRQTTMVSPAAFREGLKQALELVLPPQYLIWTGADLDFPPHPIDSADQLTRHLVEHPLSQSNPDLLLSRDDQVEAVFRLQFCPGGYFDYRPDLQILARFGAAAGLPVFLERDLISGAFDQTTPYFFAESLALVYVTLAPETAFGSDSRTLAKHWVKQAPSPQSPLIHLAASTGKDISLKARILTT